ncbi:MAG: acyl-CoA thioesterase [Trueperaceae bacterium]|nr:MAG: acyl-CoA thioesterase [Trueperaceae bacterium]
MAQPFTTAIQVRFHDTDALGHLNNTAYAAYAELARVDFIRAQGSESGMFILAHLSIDFRRQVRFGEAVSVLTAVERIGTSSLTLSHTVQSDGEVAADCRSVLVFFDYLSDRSRPIPEALRERLERFKT